MNPSDFPQYQKLKHHILEGILAGRWIANAKIPSEQELTDAFGVSRMTANRALRELANEGVITRIQGRGSFVAPVKAESTVVDVRGIREEIEARGQRHSARVLSLCAVKASSVVASQFHLRARATLFESRILHSADGVPLLLEARFVNPAVASGYLKVDFSQTTPHEYLMKVAPLERAEHLIEAETPDEQTRSLLCLTEREPVLILHRRTFSMGQVASLARLVYPASRFRLSGQFAVPGSAARNTST